MWGFMKQNQNGILEVDWRAVSVEKPSHNSPTVRWARLNRHPGLQSACFSGWVRRGYALCSSCLMEILPACTSPPGCPPQAERPRCWVGLRNPPLPSYEGSGGVVGEKWRLDKQKIKTSKQKKKKKKQRATKLTKNNDILEKWKRKLCCERR